MNDIESRSPSSERTMSQLQGTINRIMSNEDLIKALSNRHNSNPDNHHIEIVSEERNSNITGSILAVDALIIKLNKLAIRITLVADHSHLEYEISLPEAIQRFRKTKIIDGLKERFEAARTDLTAWIPAAEKTVETAKENLRSIAELSLELSQ